MKSLNEIIRRTTGLRLLVMLVFSVIVVPSLRAQSNTDFDEYKVRISGFWFYSNPSGTIQDATTGDTISLHKDIAFSSLLDLLRKAGLEVHAQEPHLSGGSSLRSVATDGA